LGTALLVFGLTACGGKGSSRLEGRWRGVRAEGVAPEAQNSADDFAKATSLEFKDDTLTMKSPKQSQTDRYRVEREDKVSIVIVTTKDGVGDPQTFMFSDAKTFKWNVQSGRSIVFAKQP
jgi:hypothetical protein